MWPLRSLTVHLPPPSLDTKGKAFWTRDNRQIHFRGLFQTMIIFSKYTQTSRIFIPFREAFLPSVWIVHEYDYINTAERQAPDHSLNYLMLAMISFLKPPETTDDGWITDIVSNSFHNSLFSCFHPFLSHVPFCDTTSASEIQWGCVLNTWIRKNWFP